MDSEQLRYFISAAQSLNFSEAARRHYITQPAISHHISDLEQYLGVKLFLRVGRQVFLTSEGEMFLPEAIAILEKMQSAALKVKRHSEGKSGNVSIGIVNTSNKILSRCLSVFSKRYPDIQVDVSMTTGTDQAASLSEGRYDFNFTIAAMVLSNQTLDYTVSHKDRYCVVMHRDHPLADQPLDFTKLVNEPFVIISLADAPLLHNQVLAICRQRGYSPKIVSHYNRAEAVMLSIGAGAGITILPSEIIHVYNSVQVKYIPIPGDDCVLPSVIAWKKNMTNTSAVKFLEVVLELYPKGAVSLEGE